MPDHHSFRSNAYLALAYRAILHARRPLTPHQMLAVAKNEGFLPDHLFGATMHRTLNARLSEYIRAASKKSEFYRTAPSTFFVHALENEPGIPPDYRTVYVGHLRSKAVRKENVLCAPKDRLSNFVYGDYVRYDEAAFERMYTEFCRFVDRREAEERDDLKQFVTFTLITHGRKLLTYRRGKFTTASDQLKGQLSVGFGGHVNDEDFDLFSRGADAFRSNAARELREELFLDEVYGEHREAIERSEVLGYVNVDDSNDARHHVAVLILFHHKSGDLPKKGELSINQLRWIDLDKPLNDLSDYDLWSEMILRNIYQGRIRVGGDAYGHQKGTDTVGAADRARQ